jgi:hypothetical protein
VPQSDWYKPLAHNAGNHHILFLFLLVSDRNRLRFRRRRRDPSCGRLVDWDERVGQHGSPAISRPSIGSTPLTSGRSRRSSKPYITQQACDIITFMFVRQPKCAAAKDTRIFNALRPGGGRSAGGDPTRRDALYERGGPRFPTGYQLRTQPRPHAKDAAATRACSVPARCLTHLEESFQRCPGFTPDVWVTGSAVFQVDFASIPPAFANRDRSAHWAAYDDQIFATEDGSFAPTKCRHGVS